MRLCSVEGCNKKHDSHGYCGMHSMRVRRTGNPYTVVNEFNGSYNNKEYGVWNAMKNRCSNKNTSQYKYYGARGIKVCSKWSNSFNSFLNDMGKRPFEGAQIDRIDNNKGYYPENCRWTTASGNARNRRNNKVNTFMVNVMRDLYKRGFMITVISSIFGISSTLTGYIVKETIWREI